MTDRPEFDDLVDGEALTPEEAGRYRRVHDLLISAGSPPELPASLAKPPAPDARIVVLTRRTAVATAAAAATLVAAAFALGLVVAHRDAGFETWRGPVIMNGESSSATASLRIGRVDASGNWPVLLQVTGLPKLSVPGATYDLVLTRGSTMGPTCGSFVVQGDTTEVTMNAPWNLRRWSGWVIVLKLPGAPPSEPILST